jgi:L-threonylcarbamoyladenylate synthase
MNQESKILKFNQDSIEKCVIAINKSNLVAFPTETVYGLGANAFDVDAVKKIFEAKKRPYSDPLIVHVHDISELERLTSLNEFQKNCLVLLGDKFWPGPLTIIVPSSNLIPSIVTSNSGYVGVRIPNHKDALKFLKELKLPLAAPSANLFGHTSPTSAMHVFSDLGYYNDLLILDTEIPCEVGIESTIIKIDNNNKISLLRPGAISTIEIQDILSKNDIQVEIDVKRRHIKSDSDNDIQSSGQFLTHYSPYIESFILRNNILNNNILENSVIIDFNGININLKEKVLHYLDLSKNGLYSEASVNLFAYLRIAEDIKNAKYILLPDLTINSNDLRSALFDRIYRAASGKFI